jgi:hypothetical protein
MFYLTECDLDTYINFFLSIHILHIFYFVNTLCTTIFTGISPFAQCGGVQRGNFGVTGEGNNNISKTLSTIYMHEIPFNFYKRSKQFLTLVV